MSKPTFIFYVDWYRYIEEDIEDEGMRVRLYRAIPRYAFTGEEPKDAATRTMFSFIRRQLDRDAEKYDAKIEKRREAGRKHSGNQYTRAKEREAEQGGTNGTSVPKMEQMEQMEQNGTNGTNGTDNTNGNANTNVNQSSLNGTLEEKEPSKEGKKNAAPHSVATLAQRSEKFYKELVPYVEAYGRKMIRDFYDYWTEPNKSKSKMRFELEKTWDLNRRLATWANRESAYDRGKAEAQSLRERNAELGRQEQREREAKRKTPEQRQTEFEAWCRENGKNPSSQETVIEYSRITA